MHAVTAEQSTKMVGLGQDKGKGKMPEKPKTKKRQRLDPESERAGEWLGT